MVLFFHVLTLNIYLIVSNISDIHLKSPLSSPNKSPLKKGIFPFTPEHNLEHMPQFLWNTIFHIEVVNSENKPKHFIEANTKEVSLYHLKNDCIIPVFSKDNEITISHSRFIEALWECTQKLFKNEQIKEPEIRVSHIIKGRTPEAIYKPVKELTDADKTIYYERMAFCMEIPTITEIVGGNTLSLTVGGVRAYNQENLYSNDYNKTQ